MSETNNSKRKISNYNVNTQLPYEIPDEKEYLKKIKENISLALLSKSYSKEAQFWFKELNRYIDLRYELPEKDRVHFAKITYNLTVTPKLENSLVEFYSSFCCKLIKKKKYIKKEKLELPWRPLYDMIKNIIVLNEKQRILLSEGPKINSLLRLITYSRRYFTSDCTEEITKEFLNKFNPHTNFHTILSQMIFELFMDTSKPPPKPDYIPDDAPPFYWVKPIFSLWTQMKLIEQYELNFINLISRLASEQVSTPWNVQWTEEQISFIFSIGLNMMELPVGSNYSNGRNLHYIEYRHSTFLKYKKNKKDKFKTLARFIIFTIWPEPTSDIPDDKKPPKLNVLKKLKDMIQAVESYFHPSNSGKWTISMTCFLQWLSIEFLRRIRMEKFDDCKTPKHLRITEEIKDEFVDILKPVVFLSVFGKDNNSVVAAQSALKNLSYIRPNLIFNEALERFYPSLESLTETHRTLSSISALSFMAVPMFTRANFSQGGKHLMLLLNIITPGIDMNDPVKTSSALLFISNALKCIPLITCEEPSSKANSYGMLDSGYEMFNDNSEDDDELCRLNTLEFTEWVIKFLDRVLSIFENLPENFAQKRSSTTELGMIQLLLHTCEVLFIQLSDEIHDIALKKIEDFARSHVIPNATKIFGSLCSASTGCNPDKALSIFLPMCKTAIESELKHDAASLSCLITESSNPFSFATSSDSTLHWYQSIIYHVVVQAGDCLLKYKSILIDVLKISIEKCKSGRGYKWAGKLLSKIIISLCKIYPLEERNVKSETWYSEEYQKTHYKSWGIVTDMDELDIKWHVPSDEEINFAIELIDLFIIPAQAKLKELLTNELSKHENVVLFNKNLTIINNCLKGMSSLYFEQEDNKNDDSLLPSIPKLLPCGFCLTDENDPRTIHIKQINKDIGKLLHEISLYLLTEQKNNIECYRILLTVMKTYINDHGIEKTKFENHYRSYKYLKGLIKTVQDKRSYPRCIHVQKAYIHHLKRMRYNYTVLKKIDIYDDLFEDLFQMSISSYAETRKTSQTLIAQLVKTYPDYKFIIIQKILEIIETSSNSEPDKAKGALYLLRQKPILRVCFKHWDYLSKLTTTMCVAPQSEKTSVQELFKKLFVNYAMNFSDLPMEQILTDETKVSIMDMVNEAEITLDQNLIDKQYKIIDDIFSKYESVYNGIVSILLSTLKKNGIHWRLATMTNSILELYMREDKPISLEASKYFIEHTIDSLYSSRKINISAVSRVLNLLKIRSKLDKGRNISKELKIDYSFPENTSKEDRIKVFSLDNEDNKFNDCKDILYLDNSYIGWLCWPKTFKVYKQNIDDNDQFPYFDPDSKDVIDYILQEFSKPDYWKQLLEFMSMENSRPNTEAFSTTNIKFFKHIFQLYEDRFLYTCIEPTLKEYCLNFQDKYQQRAAAEIVAGIIRGSRNWSTEKLDKLWEWLKPTLKSVLQNVIQESIDYWISCIQYSCVNRDARRFRPIINIILGENFDPLCESFYTETKKLNFISIILNLFNWKINNKVDNLMKLYFDNFNHPYKYVRESLALNINEIIKSKWHVGEISAENILKKYSVLEKGGLNEICNFNPVTPDIQELFDNFEKKMAQWKVEKCENSNQVISSTNYANAGKTFMSWMYNSLRSLQSHILYPYVNRMVSILIDILNYEDTELQEFNNNILHMYAQIIYPQSMVEKSINQLLDTINATTTWHIKMKILPVLQVYFFKHLFYISSELKDKIIQLLAQTLQDSRIEVRQLANETLSGIIRCSSRESIEQLKNYFEGLLKEKLPKKSKNGTIKDLKEKPEYNKILIKRHAGVLGLSSLVQAFPYDIPNWLPEVLCSIALCINNPSPIHPTVKKTYADFKRTHQDTWHEDIQKFTEDQLSILTDLLISPSYYA